MKVAFLDRDGVINKEKHYVHKIADFEFVPGVIQAMRKLCSMGYRIIIVTNQAGIAKQIFTESDYWRLTKWYLKTLSAEGVDVLDVFYCPHHLEGIVEKYRLDCCCRKPKPGMFKQACIKHDIDLSQSFLVGDKLSDLHAGSAAGINRLILVRSGHLVDESDVNIKCQIYNSLLEYSDSLS